MDASGVPNLRLHDGLKARIAALRPLEESEMSLVEQTRWPDHCYDEGKLKYPACIPEGLA